jgi:DNA-binding response OmpR family regulator
MMSTRPVSILYVDDDPALSRLVQRNLGRRGYVVELASSAEKGFSRLAKGGIDVIAPDHFLPVGTGLEFLKELASHESQPPVVYVAASGDTSVAVAALKAGADYYVPKATGDEFLELLTNAIDQALEKAQRKRAREQAEREMREARERAEVLLEEVNHRVANSLALVMALVQLQARSTNDASVRASLVEVQTRILATAAVHRSLYTSADVRTVEIADYLSNLLVGLQLSLKTSCDKLEITLHAEAGPRSDRQSRIDWPHRHRTCNQRI